MNSTTPASLTEKLLADLCAYRVLCEEVLNLVTRENQALAGANYDSAEFSRDRKNLLPRLDKALMILRGKRNEWQRGGLGHDNFGADVKNLFQTIQDVIMKILLLDRDNQQALLHRGLVPAKHLPAVTARQPHCVADVYRRHATI